MKQNNDSGAIETTLIGLLFSLTFSSIVIAFLLVQFYGAGVSGVYPAINSVPDTGILSSFQNYKTNSISDNVNYMSKNSGSWVYVAGVGRVLTGTGGSFGLLNPIILLEGAAPINDEYIIRYAINNTVQGDYGILVRYSKNPSDVVVYVKSDGFHIPNTLTGWEKAFFPYPDANQVTKVNIRTEFNEKQGTLKFYFNDNLAFIYTNIPQQIVIPFTVTHYAGVLSNTDYFTLESIDIGAIDLSDSNIMKSVSAFIIVLARIVVWNVDSAYLPIELNFILIKTQLFGVIVCAIMIIRGN
jgi:hypothetical protein